MSMGAGGRPPLPTAVKAERGTLRKHREAGKGPDAAPLTAVPQAPERFTPQDYALAEDESDKNRRRSNLQRRLADSLWMEWATDLVERKVLTRSDLRALEMCCWEYARWLTLSSVIEEEGATVEQCNGEGAVLAIVSHPAVGQMDRAQTNAGRLMDRLGLDPLARVRVRGAATDESEQNPIAKLLEMRRGPQGVVSGGQPPAEE